MHEGRLIEFDRVSFAYSSEPVLEDLAFGLYPGQFVGIVGPNGAGKSTVLKLMNRLLAPSKGEVRIAGRSVSEYSLKELARLIAFVPQEPEYFPFTVRELVTLGRSPYRSGYGSVSPRDAEIVEEAMREAGVVEFADRPVDQLSGGERQRVTVARALAQKTPILLLDEPTNHLDIEHQLHICRLLQAKANAGMTCVAVLHDLNLVASYCHEVLVLDLGRLVAHGAPGGVLTPELVQEVYHVHIPDIRHPVTGRPVIAP
ncbi:MAG: ABC transporter ATP-binding protein [Firmicutes bacterium]|nr:ABC transporter ATP-binding protein [Bacillota bacterium]